jgi:hypothetical protein
MNPLQEKIKLIAKNPDFIRLARLLNLQDGELAVIGSDDYDGHAKFADNFPEIYREDELVREIDGDAEVEGVTVSDLLYVLNKDLELLAAETDQQDPHAFYERSVILSRADLAQAGIMV